MESQYLTLDEALDFIEGMCGEAECEAIKSGEYVSTPSSELASQVYRILHAHRGHCGNPHEDWKLKK